MNNKPIFHPIISSIQKIILYETKSKFYLVGTNNTQTRFRVLKIDRMEPRELIINDDKVEYTKNEIHNLVNMIDSGNRQKSGSGFSNITSAFGIVGFIRFLEGYYIILVTKRRKAAVIGYHTIYKVECTSMIYIPHDSVRLLHPDEPRYYKMFQGVDLSSNFYFSYSYDVTHTLQHNMSAPNCIIPNHICSNNDTSDNSDDECDVTTMRRNNDPPLFPNQTVGRQVPLQQQQQQQQQQQEYGVRAKPHRRFVWNGHLVGPVEKVLHPDWLLYVVHGFVGQANVSVFGRPVYITLLARRSCRYAGTRFLKRGANSRGDVANEVETEQIVHDSHVSALHRARIASFVQMRGSIPGQWRQDMGRVVAKPAITIDLHDPLAEVAGAHFANLLRRYGGPIVLLNLVKRHERKAQERLLSDELLASVRYLSQFLPQGSVQSGGQSAPLQYRAFDMARKNKSSVADVMGQLAGIARAIVAKTGFYHSEGGKLGHIHQQTGIVRTNCVDCLDRTNTAQFALGRCALGVQLTALGLMATTLGQSAGPLLPFDCDCVRMLESLYEDHGDTLALQYGGSQLVHRVRTYRKTAPWTSHGNDIMQTLSRYYSNTFSDADKQCSMNLFLGLYECTSSSNSSASASAMPISGSNGSMAIWDLPSDYYLHHVSRPLSNMAATYRSTAQLLWAALGSSDSHLPLDTQQKAASELIRVLDGAAGGAEMVDAFADYHRPYELTSLTDHYAFQLDHSVRDYMPSATLDYNPFRVRVRPGRRREQQGNYSAGAGAAANSSSSSVTNPSLSGLSSNSSAASSNSSSTDDGENSESSTALDCDEFDPTAAHNATDQSVAHKVTRFDSLFPPFEVVYGTDLGKDVGRNDMLLYKKYVLIGRRANTTTLPNTSQFNSTFRSSKQLFNSADSSYSVKVPVVPTKAFNVYSDYVSSSLNGATDPTTDNLNVYKKYISMK